MKRFLMPHDGLKLSCTGSNLYHCSHLIFFALLAFHVLIYCLSPFEGKYPILPVWQGLVGFLLIFAASAKLMMITLLLPKKKPSADWLNCFNSGALIKILFAIASIGLCLHIFAKYYLTTYRPTTCLFEIRFLWIEISHDMQPWHIRISSILGHLLSSFAYVGAFVSGLNAARYFETEKWKHLRYLLVFLLIGTVYAGFIGSRNAAVAYLIVTFSGILLGICSRPARWTQSLKILCVTLLLPFMAAVLFSTMVFLDRIHCGAKKTASPTTTSIVKSADTQADHAIAYLQSNCRTFAVNCEPSSAHDPWQRQLAYWCPPCGPTMLYLDHGLLNFAQIIASDQRGEQVLFQFFESIPIRLGLIKKPDTRQYQRAYGAGGTTLAGGAYHDYGIPGFILTAIVLGIIYGAGLRLMNMGGIYSLIGMGMYVSCFYVMMISNMFIGTNVLSFPFIVFSFFAVIAFLIWKQRRIRSISHAG